MAYGVTWNGTFDGSPVATDNIGNGYAEILALKQGVRERIGRDHEFDMANSGTIANQAVHKKGSARAFMSVNSPTNLESANLASDITNIHDGKIWFQANSRVMHVQTNGAGSLEGWQPATIHPRVHEWTTYPAAPTSMQLAGVSYHQLTTTAEASMAFDIAATPPPLNGAVAIIDNKSDQIALVTLYTGMDPQEQVAAQTSAIFVYNNNVWTRITGLAAQSLSGYSVDPNMGANTIPVRANGPSNAGRLPGDIEGNANGASWLNGLANTDNVPAGAFAAMTALGAACANCVAVYDAPGGLGGRPRLHCDVDGTAYEAQAIRMSGGQRRVPSVEPVANTVVVRESSGNINGNFNGPVRIGSTFVNLGNGSPAVTVIDGNSFTPPSAGIWCVYMAAGSVNVSYKGTFLFRIENNQTPLVVTSDGKGDWVFADVVYGVTTLWYWKL